MIPESDPARPRHPIRVVADRTGVNPNLLRAWERRYAVVSPGRSDGGQRIYSDADIERLLLLKRASDAGRSISSVAPLSNVELSALLEEDEMAREERQAAYLDADAVSDHVRAAMEAVEGLDPKRLEQILQRELVTLGADRFLDELVTPVLVAIGDRWRAGELRPAHEHVAVAVIKQILGWILERSRTGAAGRTIVVGMLSGESHELGALLASTTAALSGWDVVFLGQDLPPEEIALAARSLEASAVGISVVNPLDWEGIPTQIRDLLDAMPQGVPLVLGGAASVDMARVVADVRVRAVDSLPQFRSLLAELSREDASA